MKEGQSPGRDLGMWWLQFWKEVEMNRRQCLGEQRQGAHSDIGAHPNHKTTLMAREICMCG